MSKKEQELFEDRLKKLKALKKSGVDPYPATAKRTHIVSEVLRDFSKLKDKKVTLSGRVRALRGHGALSFGNLEDGSGNIQFLLKEDESGKELLTNFSKFVDIGDFLEISGNLLRTKRGEKSVLVKKYRILTKSLRALPEKWHGLKDVELRLRKRYVDMIANPEVREMFEKKAVFWQTVRDEMAGEGFLEVQTPVLEHVTGGAEATPFVTHHNALDQDYFLRISLELPLKRLLVGGMERVFEIGRVFRNEGIDREHLQEYDSMEFYWAYADWEDGMKLTERMFKKIVKNVTGSTKTEYNGNKIDWGKKWHRVDYFDVLKKESGIDLDKDDSLPTLRKKADSLGVKHQRSDGAGRLVDVIYKKTVRPKLIQPTFLVGHPKIVSPLSKSYPDNPKKVQRFQLLVGGTELCNAYSELNDPVDQRERFEEQEKLRKKGDEVAQMMDIDFVEALEYGMPPAVGFGMSERVFAVLMNKSIRETVIFPPMKSK